MPVLRVALAQVDVTVGDLAANAAMIRRRTAEAAAVGAQLIAFPELALTGYPPEDLVLRASFRAASQTTLHQLAAELAADGHGERAVVVGYVDDDTAPGAGPGAAGGPRNASAVLTGGRVAATYYKHHLPNYGVFDERRYFVPGTSLTVVRMFGVDVALTVCEDIWQDGGPFAMAREAGAGLVVNINASPYERDKDDVRLALLQRRVAEAGATVLYVNTVGAQDELVYDGDSMIVAADGSILLRAPQYVEGMYYLDLDVPAASPVPPATASDVRRVSTELRHGAAEATALPALAAPPVAPRLCDEAEVWGALVAGLGDYVRKNGFRSVVFGMSGGIDSAVVAAVAADAIGGENVFGVSLPSAYSSEHSLADAAELAKRIGADYSVVPIADMVTTFVDALQLTGLAEENVQARVRGAVLMALSNAHGHLVLAPGNKSELAVGYSTIYGDAVGGFAPIKDVPKTLVWQLARWRNAEAERRGETAPIPPNSISKPPSAELRPGQLDTDSLPDYELLDAILERYVDGDQGVATIVTAGFDAELVQRVAAMVDRAEWKRRQYPPGPKISDKAFGRDRRLPITNRWVERTD